MKHLYWEKIYKGPFSQREAELLSKQLQDIANPEVNAIYDAMPIRRPRKPAEWDVYIKTEVFNDNDRFIANKGTGNKARKPSKSGSNK